MRAPVAAANVQRSRSLITIPGAFSVAPSRHAAQSSAATVTAGSCQSQSTPAWTRKTTKAASAALAAGWWRARANAATGGTSANASRTAPISPSSANVSR